MAADLARALRGCSGIRWRRWWRSCGLKKSRCGQCGTVAHGYYDKRTRHIRDLSCGDVRIYLEVEVRRVRCRKCGKVKTEQLDWKRFYRHVGRKCRTMSIKDVAAELHLDWHADKELDKRYMQEQLRRTPKPAPAVIGIDEIAIRRGFTYRLVATDLIRRRAIWFGGVDRSEASLDAFWAWLGGRQTARVRLVVMDMWRAFENSTRRNAPQAAILYDKFHVVSCLGEALDEVRKQEYAQLAGRDRSFIKGQKYTLLSNRANLTLNGRKALNKLLAANKRLNAAYLLKESFGQLWNYKTEGWARRFFENWKAALKWATPEALREVRPHGR
ncbi:MAG: ISL3 family transposase [Kiritimatiellae bacterium]|nr:ISL3 family transposase [Kiritimatiellia bacterium]MBP9571725.1 ISL3 family transposase [Kiritimatiellia bacterium]